MEKAFEVSHWDLSEEEFERDIFCSERFKLQSVTLGEGYSIEDYYADNGTGVKLEKIKENWYWYYTDKYEEEKRFVIIDEIKELTPEEAKKFYDSWNR